MNDNHRKYLPVSATCFVCGDKNPAGLRTRLYVEDDAVFMPFTAHVHHCGYPGTVHGGIVATALDECMAWAATRAIGLMCLTAELTVRYLAPTPARAGLVVRSDIEKASRRIVYTTAALTDESGKTYAQAKGRFLPMSKEDTLRVDDGLVYFGNEERLFDYLRAKP